MDLLTLLLLVGVAVVAVPACYLYALAIAAIRGAPKVDGVAPRCRFAVAIAAHDEESVIAETVRRLRQQDYPADLFDVHVVADHCSDETASIARAAGAIVHERSESPAGSKGAALRWLFQRIFASSDASVYDAVVIFDADTQADLDFLQVMNARLAQGAMVIQGQHRIRNPEDGWFPALTWAMFLIDNRLQNLGRSNLNWSAKNMGDSICFRAEVLQRLGWGEGLTEDYAFRQQLLLEGIRIAYEPAAVGYGEAPLTWTAARRQRARWLRGAHDASRRYAGRLLAQALVRRSVPLLDGALQARLPSYSSLTLIAIVAWLVQALLIATRIEPASQLAVRTWAMYSLLIGALFAYPLIGLVLERAPLRAYLVIVSGPIFIIWRTWLALTSRRRNAEVLWIRTPRKRSADASAEGARA